MKNDNIYGPGDDDYGRDKWKEQAWTAFIKSLIKMSWSITTSGTPEEVVLKLEEQSNILSGQSKEEYDSALPHMIAIVKENINGTINLNAYGHGSKDAEGKYYNKSCTVNISR
jgi:hypothetical protein